MDKARYSNLEGLRLHRVYDAGGTSGQRPDSKVAGLIS
jgi:hypothetical protein